MLGYLLAAPTGLAETLGEAVPEARLSYHIDRQDVPSWVVQRQVTLIVQVGPAMDVVAIADGQAARCLYDGNRALVTTSFDDVEVIVTGPQWPLAEMGDVQLAALQDDKDWALSLTLDDGYESQATTAKELLDRYGYKATIAVVGARIGINFNGDTYASAEQLRSVVADGWQLANHTNSHLKAGEIGTENQVVKDISSANRAIMEAVPGYVPIMFTSPFVDTAFEPIIRGHVEELGFHLLQTYGWEGRRADPGAFGVDPEGVVSIGRTQLLHDTSQFDQVQTWLAREPGSHWWLSLHTHDVYDACDCMETSIDRLYDTYGAGGIDNVWVAPAPDVFQYLIVRNHVVVTETERTTVGKPLGVMPTLQAPVTPTTQTLRLQQGLDGYSGTLDATIDAYHTQTNRGHDGGISIRTQNGLQGLISFDLARLPEDAVVDAASLRLFGVTATNQVTTCLDAHRLLRPWLEMQVTWNQAMNGTAWQVPGAAGANDRTPGHVGLRGLVPAQPGWYALDLTETVRYWAEHPQENHGVILIGSGQSSRQVSLASSEYNVPEQRPVLDIVYHIPQVETRTVVPSGDATLLGGLVFSERGTPPSVRWVTPVTVTLEPENDLGVRYVLALETGEHGEFLLADIAQGTYTITVTPSNALPIVRPGTVLSQGLNVISFGPALMGDVAKDNLVSARDWAAIMSSFGSDQGQAAYRAAADLNADGRVDILDMTILHTYYGRYGSVVEPATGAPGERTATIRMVPSSAQARLDAPVSVQLVLDTGDHAVNGVDLGIVFDQNVLTLTSATLSPQWPVTLPGHDLDGADGRLRIIAGRFASSVTGTVTLLDLVFVPQVVTGQSGSRIYLGSEAGLPASVTEFGYDVLGLVQGGQVDVLPHGILFPWIVKPGVAAAQARVQTLDVNLQRTLQADAVALPLMGSMALPQVNFEARDVRVRNQYAYLALATYYSSNTGDPYLYVADISDVSAPRAVGSLTALSRDPDELWIEGDRVYVARKGSGAEIVDITQATQPQGLSTFFWTTEDRPIAKGLHVYQQRMYIADERYGLQIVDVSDGSAPRLLGSYDEGMFGEGVWSDGVTAWVAADRDELYRPVVYAIDVSNPTRPRYLTKLIPPETRGRAVDVQLEGDLLYVAAELGGICVFDVSNPAAPVFRGALQTQFAQKIDVVGDLVLVADDLGGVVAVNASDPSAMRSVGYYDTPGRAFGISAQDGYAFVADGASGMHVLDLGVLTPTPTPTPTLTPTPTALVYRLDLPVLFKQDTTLPLSLRR